MAIIKPPQRKHVVMWARLAWHGYKAHTVTVTLVYQSGGVYALYVSGRKLESVASITAAQCWFVSKVKYFIDDFRAIIVAGGVYFGGQ